MQKTRDPMAAILQMLVVLKTCMSFEDLRDQGVISPESKPAHEICKFPDFFVGYIEVRSRDYL